MAHILIAEDDDNLRFIVREILEGRGHRVQEADDGVPAWSLAQQESFDLVITDIMMPEKNGFELITDLRKIMPELKIIAMSAGGSIDARHLLKQATECGANQTLTKPFTKQDILDVVDKVLLQTSTTAI